MHATCSHLGVDPTFSRRVVASVVRRSWFGEEVPDRGASDARGAVVTVYNDPMVANLVYRLEAEHAEEQIVRRRTALEHPGLIRRPSLRVRARRLWARISSGGSGEPG